MSEISENQKKTLMNDSKFNDTDNIDEDKNWVKGLNLEAKEIKKLVKSLVKNYSNVIDIIYNEIRPKVK